MCCCGLTSAKRRTFVAQEFSHRTLSGYEVAAKFHLYTPKQFTTQFGVEASKLGLGMDVLVDCNGQRVSGHLVKDEGPLEVRCFHKVLE